MSESADALPLGPGVRVLDRAGDLIAIEKPAGVLSHPNRSGSAKRCLLEAEYDPDSERYRFPAGELYLLHRLDAPTSGVVVAATDPGVARAGQQAFAERRVRKQYAAAVKGAMRERSAVTWRDRLAVERRSGALRVRTGGDRHAETRARPRAGGGDVSLLTLEPRTGRPHQLRVQAAARGLPIVGDKTYGDFAFNRRVAQRSGHKRLFLHAESIEIDYELEGETYTARFAAPLPEAFEALIAFG